MQRPRVDTVAVGSYTEQLFRKQLGSIRNYIMYTYKSVSSQNKRMSLLPQYRLGADARSIVSTDPGGTEPLLHTGRCARHHRLRFPANGHEMGTERLDALLLLPTLFGTGRPP